jgi:hypothetical protein
VDIIGCSMVIGHAKYQQNMITCSEKYQLNLKD